MYCRMNRRNSYVIYLTTCQVTGHLGMKHHFNSHTFKSQEQNQKPHSPGLSETLPSTNL